MNIKEILNGRASFEMRFIEDKKILKEVVVYLKQGGFRIVLTQGVFDLLHVGHAKYLEAARSCGDVLLVGVDSDELTRSRKEPNRPIVPEIERLELLACLRSVDILTLRTVEENLDDLIKLVQPAVLIASETTKDFTVEKLKELEQFCGEIKRLPAQATTSTTAMIRKMEIGGADNYEKILTEEVTEAVRRAKIRMKKDE